VVAATTATDGQDAVRVFDGGPVRESEVPADVIAIGFSAEDDTVVTDTRTAEQMASSPDTERYDVTCVASSWKGQKTDAKAVRDRAYELVDLLAAELANDPTLGRTVLRARVSSTSMGQAQTNLGATCSVTFTVSVMAVTGG
jgi:hypothetical protein